VTNVAISEKKMVCTDLDGTLVGDDWSMYRLFESVDTGSILLVFCTGRDLPSVLGLIERKGIPAPDVCICQVGTEIYYFLDEPTPDEYWRRIISTGWCREAVLRLLGDIGELELQEDRWQTEFKISYYLEDEQVAAVAEARRRIEEAGLEARLVYSQGRYVDVLPVRAGKAQAAQHVADMLGVRREDVVVCGDSGNDLDFFRAGLKGVIVGNASSELKRYRGENAYHAEGEYGAGMIEGLEHFGFI